MCGITGIVSRSDRTQELLAEAERLQWHRGPDARDTRILKVGGWTVGLGHQRLSILDLSPAGNQPMACQDESGWIVYNGEVYNFHEIREELKTLGWTFHSESDTEVILAALQAWDLPSALSRFNGMWAFAWLDLRGKRLVICRDRIGVKPLHFTISDNELIFASELKSVLGMSGRRFPLNDQVVGEYLLQSLQESSNETIFKGIHKLPPGHFAVVDLTRESVHLEISAFWGLRESQEWVPRDQDLVEYLRELFLDAVRLRLRSDVPVGVLLSGGLDSSSIAWAVREIQGTSEGLNLISAVSRDPRFDESHFIDIMSDHLKCSTAKVVLDPEPSLMLDLLEVVCWQNDEPVGSFSNVAHYLLMKQAKELGITVILSGQGADESLCGYKKYLGFYVMQLLKERRVGTAIDVLARFGLNRSILNQFSYSEAKRYLPSSLRRREIDIRGDRLRSFVPVPTGMAGCHSVNERQRLDFERFSIPALVHYEDRMSMAWSREIRVPFLDYRLVELLLPLPIDKKLYKGWTKYIFRKAMEGRLPDEITWRKDKQGFVNPQSEWLKSDLKEKVQNYFKPDSLMALAGFVNPYMLNKKYESYCRQSARQGIVSYKDIFNPLALEIWLRKYENYIKI